ncbi:MAG: hypothetical protein ACYDC0_16880 [Acidimicrobiales bacterium]
MRTLLVLAASIATVVSVVEISAMSVWARTVVGIIAGTIAMLLVIQVGLDHRP